MRWNDTAEWVWSEQQVHEPLISIEGFETGQTRFDRTKRRTKRTPSKGRRYLLTGMVRCGICGRRMQGQWNHGQHYYRCKFPTDYPTRRGTSSEERLRARGRDRARARRLARLPVLRGAPRPHLRSPSWLRRARPRGGRSPNRASRTDPVLRSAARALPSASGRRRGDRHCREVDRRGRTRAKGRPGHSSVAWWPGGKLTKSQARALVEARRDIVDVLAEADPEDKAELYAELGVGLTYYTDGRVAVQALARVKVRVGGGLVP
jgi:site-specific DNA recombinase